MISLKEKDWRQILNMNGRALRTTVRGTATTRDGIQKMKEEIAQAETDAKKQHRKLLIQFHPDRHFGKDMSEVNGVISEAYNKSEREFEDMKRWLDNQSNAVPG